MNYITIQKHLSEIRTLNAERFLFRSEPPTRHPELDSGSPQASRSDRLRVGARNDREGSLRFRIESRMAGSRHPERSEGSLLIKQNSNSPEFGGIKKLSKTKLDKITKC